MEESDAWTLVISLQYLEVDLKVHMPNLTCIFYTFNWLTLTSEMHFCEVSPWGSFLFSLQRQRKVCTPGMRLSWKYIRNYFLVYHFIFTFFVISPKLQRIWSWNFGFANRKIGTFIWYQKMYHFRLSPGGWECDRHKVLSHTLHTKKKKKRRLSPQECQSSTLKALMPITFSSPRAQPEVVYFLISNESPYFSDCKSKIFSLKFFVVLEI